MWEGKHHRERANRLFCYLLIKYNIMIYCDSFALLSVAKLFDRLQRSLSLSPDLTSVVIIVIIIEFRLDGGVLEARTHTLSRKCQSGHKKKKK